MSQITMGSTYESKITYESNDMSSTYESNYYE